MGRDTWTVVFYLGNVALLLLLFFILVDRKRLGELIPVGLLIAAENYTVELLGLHHGLWRYPMKWMGYPWVVIASSLIYFPLLAMLFYQYLGESMSKNMLLVGVFTGFNMVVEVITLYTTNLFVYGRFMSLAGALLLYLFAYALIILFRRYYRRVLIV